RDRPYAWQEHCRQIRSQGFPPLFFFYRSRRHRYLHSFPTRRSSDLPLIKERILVIILLLHFLSLMLGSVLVLMLPLLVWKCSSKDWQSGSAGMPGPISYAVFCLKNNKAQKHPIPKSTRGPLRTTDEV